MLRRTPFKARAKAKPREERAPLPFPSPARLVAPTVFNDMVLPHPKGEFVRSEAYRRAVASMPCKICGIAGYSQCAHSNTGKGMGLKSSDLESFPACADREGIRGCHSMLDSGALYPKLVRQALEPAWAADTRRYIIAAGLWPKNLPHYTQENEHF